MCLLVFAFRSNADYPLLIAANRDEFHRRPTSVARFWPEAPELLAGRDEQLGGTWMGVTRTGKFAAVTNFRDPAASALAPRSRGELPLDYLLGELPADDYLKLIAQRASEYAGFNLLLGDRQNLWYYNNSPPANSPGPGAPMRLTPGVYGLSNARLNTPWPKVLKGKSQLEQTLESREPPGHDALLCLIDNTELASTQELNSLGMDTQMEQLLSAQFIRSETYGTRSSTTLLVDRYGHMSWRELSFNPLGELNNTVLEEFQTIAPH
jgi:uncharacterized protein with NRDE domain